MNLFDLVRSQVIGEGLCVTTPLGQRRLTYSDHAATGRGFAPIEAWILAYSIPNLGNTHTETSHVGAQTTAFREQARQVIKAACGCTDEDALIFCGNGMTGAIHTLIGCLGLQVPCFLKDTYGLSIPKTDKPVVFLSAFEHHSADLPWRHCEVDVEVVRECGVHGIGLDHLAELLVWYRGRRLIGCFSAASNVTGRLTDVSAVARVMHEHGGVVFFDYAAAGPYVDIEVNSPDPLTRLDALFLSTHKLLGGPGAPGVLIAKRHLFRNRVPAVPGGGTVASVTPTKHSYLTDVEHREEGGTPNIVGSIRAGLAFQLKQSVGAATILAHEQAAAARFIAALRDEPGVHLLGDLDEPRLGIVSFVVQHAAPAEVPAPQWPFGQHVNMGDGVSFVFGEGVVVQGGIDDVGGRVLRSGAQTKALHHNFVVALLNDLFGVQARGGNSCAAPYAHRLLNVGETDEAAIEACVEAGWHGVKPGWTRLSFGWYDSDDTLIFLIECVRFIARRGAAFLNDYIFDAKTGSWKHRGGSPPLLALGESAPSAVLPESVRWGYLTEAERLAVLPRAPVAMESTPFEGIRWFFVPGEVVS